MRVHITSLSKRPYSLLQEVCINCCVLVFYKMDGRHWVPSKIIWCSLKENYIILELNSMSSHYILSIKAYSLLKRCLSIAVIQPPHFLRVKEGSLKRKEFKSKYVLVFYKMDGWHWVMFHINVTYFYANSKGYIMCH